MTTTLQRTVAETVWELIRAQGVQRIYGNPGSTEMGFLGHAPPTIDYVLCLHEAIVVAAAMGDSLAGGKPAVVNLHAAPGVGNAVGAIAAARTNRAPVVILVGQQDSRHLLSDPLLSGDVVSLSRPVTKWSHESRSPSEVVEALGRAFAAAVAPPAGPTLVSVPMDQWLLPANTTLRAVPHTSLGGLAPDASRSLAGELQRGKRVAMIVGAGIEVADAWDEAVRLAEEVDLDVWSAPFESQLGFPTSHPRFRGFLGMDLAQIGSQLQGYDHILLAGCSAFRVYPYTDAEPLRAATCVLLTDNVEEAARFDSGRSFLVDLKSCLATIAADLATIEDGRVTQPSRGPRTESLETSSATTLTVAEVCSKALDFARRADAFVVDESVSNGPAVRAHLDVSRPRSYLRNGNGAIGLALSAALGVALQGQGRPVLAIVGDGSLLFAPQSLWTVADKDLPLKVVVLDNGGYQVLQRTAPDRLTAEQRTSLFSTRGLDIAATARSFGVPAVTAATSDELDLAIEAMERSPGPFLLQVQLPPQP